MFNVFLIILVFILITGYYFGSTIVFSSNRISDSNSISLGCLYPIFMSLWFSTPFIILILRTQHDSANNNFLYLLLLNLMFVVCSAFSALYARIWQKKVELKLGAFSNYKLWLTRILLIIYGGICMLCAISITKSTFYWMGISQYTIDDNLNELMQSKNNKKLDYYNEGLKKYNYFLNEFIDLNQRVFEVQKVNNGWFKKTHYNIEMNREATFKLIYNFSVHRSKHSRVPIHTVEFVPKNKEKSTCKIYLGLSDQQSIEVLSYKLIEQKIVQQLKDYELLIEQVNDKPGSLSIFAYANILSRIGIKNYRVTPKEDHNTTENVEIGIFWFFAILSIIVFSEMIRKRTV